jgi:hypothetical protein
MNNADEGNGTDIKAKNMGAKGDSKQAFVQ